MDTIVYILLGVILTILLAFLLIYLLRTNKKSEENNDSALLQKDIENSKNLLEQQVKTLQEQLKTQKEDLKKLISSFQSKFVDENKVLYGDIGKLQESLKNFKDNSDKQDSDLNNRLNNEKNVLSNSITEVLKNLENLKKSSETLNEVDEKVKKLNDIFLNSKKRGNLGEYLLETILIDMFGNNHNIWKRQYKLPSGGMVDAFVKTEGNNKEGIAIDSKFPYENYNKYLDATEKLMQDKYLSSFKTDLQNRVSEVAKYISFENNISSAIMFIPSEDIFSFIYAQFPDDFVKFAFKKHVWLASPTTLSAILFIIDKHLKEVEFNKNIEITKLNLQKIKIEFDRWIERWKDFTDSFDKVNNRIQSLNITHGKIIDQYQKISNDQLIDENEEN